MVRYVIQRLLLAIPILLLVSVIIFIIMRVAPGDVAKMILQGGSGATPEAVAKLREQLGLNAPLEVQYWDFLSGLVRLDPGNSLWTGDPVRSLIASRINVTLELALLGFFWMVIIGVPSGVLSAIYHGSVFDHASRIVAIVALAVPHFWLGTLIILGLAVRFGWTPPLGFTHFTTDPWNNLQQMFWPSLVVGYGAAASVNRMTRSAMLEVMRDDYVRTARAKGLGETTVILNHALRTALLPVVTIAALQVGRLLGGAVITETIFTLPGLGRFLVDGINHRDYPVVQTIVVLAAFVFVVVNLLTDLLYGWLDPRVRST